MLKNASCHGKRHMEDGKEAEAAIFSGLLGCPGSRYFPQ
jgi:hypothetical protein